MAKINFYFKARSLDDFILLDKEGISWNPKLPFKDKYQVFASPSLNGIEKRNRREMRESIIHNGVYLVVNSEKGLFFRFNHLTPRRPICRARQLGMFSVSQGRVSVV